MPCKADYICWRKHSRCVFDGWWLFQWIPHCLPRQGSLHNAFTRRYAAVPDLLLSSLLFVCLDIYITSKVTLPFSMSYCWSWSCLLILLVIRFLFMMLHAFDHFPLSSWSYYWIFESLTMLAGSFLEIILIMLIMHSLDE